MISDEFCLCGADFSSIVSYFSRRGGGGGGIIQMCDAGSCRRLGEMVDSFFLSNLLEQTEIGGAGRGVKRKEKKNKTEKEKGKEYGKNNRAD